MNLSWGTTDCGPTALVRNPQSVPGNSQSSTVNGYASVHAATKMMSNAISSLSQAAISATGRPLKSLAVDCDAAITIGTKNGSDSIGNNSSASRVLTAIALNNVPMATRPTAARNAIAMSGAATSPSGRL